MLRPCLHWFKIVTSFGTLSRAGMPCSEHLYLYWLRQHSEWRSTMWRTSPRPCMLPVQKGLPLIGHLGAPKYPSDVRHCSSSRFLHPYVVCCIWTCRTSECLLTFSDIGEAHRTPEGACRVLHWPTALGNMQQLPAAAETFAALNLIIHRYSRKWPLLVAICLFPGLCVADSFSGLIWHIIIWCNHPGLDRIEYIKNSRHIQ